MTAPVDLGIDGLVEAREVGRGGFAVVYRARQPDFDRVVAVKVLRVNPDERRLERFQREVRAMGKLSEHPSIATVLDAGTTEHGEPYLLMPFLSGGSLQDALDGGMRLSGREAGEIGTRLADAAAAAHREGILHRDIKPANVMLGRYGDPLLVDFGIARMAGGRQTTSGVVTATLSHAAPELLDGHPPSVASDVYALGSTLFALVHGSPAFDLDTDESVLPLIRRILTEPLPDLREDGVEDVIARVIERAMAKSPEDRFPTAEAMGQALQEALEGQMPAEVGDPVRGDPLGRDPLGRDPLGRDPLGRDPVIGQQGAGAPADGGAGAGPAVAVTVPPGEVEPRDRPRRSRATVVAGTLVAVVVAVVIGAVVTRSGQDDQAGAGADAGDVAAAGVEVPPGVPLGGVDETGLEGLAAPERRERVEVDTVFEVSVPAEGSVALAFTVEEPSALRATTASIDEVDPIAGLYRDGEVLAADDDGAGGLEVGLDHPDLPPGEYELRLVGLAGPGAVSLSLQVPVVEQLDGPREGELADVHDVEAYRVELRPEAAVGVRVSTEDEVRVVAYDAPGRPVGAIDGSGELPLELAQVGSASVVVLVAPSSGGARFLIEPF